MAKFFCVLYNLSSETWLKQCWEWRNWETIFIWSAYYLCTYSECEGKSHCKYVLLCNLYCNYMNRCNNVAFTIIIFGGKDRPLDKKRTWYGVKFIYWSYFMHDDYANQRQSIETITFKYSTQHQMKFVKFWGFFKFKDIFLRIKISPLYLIICIWCIWLIIFSTRRHETL